MTPITRVQTLVCETYGITIAQLIGKDRHKTIVEARVVAMFLCRIHLADPPSFPEIGRAFGGRDHTTVMSNVKSALVKMGRHPRIAARVAAFAAELGTAPTGRADISHMPGLARIELADDFVSERAARFAGARP